MKYENSTFIFCTTVPSIPFLRWKHETNPSMSCYGGKVILSAYPGPPPEMKQLWFEDSPGARLFRQHSRSVNNAVNLSSYLVNERKHKSGTSSVVMMGKLTQLVGSLQPVGEDRAKFAQLYTVDPAVEETTRVGNFYMPDSLLPRQKALLTNIMWQVAIFYTFTLQYLLLQVVGVLKRDNPLVADFRMACEQWEAEGVRDGRLVISAKARPAGEHARLYNLQVD